VPQVGKMHIYQRFLLPSQLLLSAVLGIMLRNIIKNKPVDLIKKVLFVFVILTISIAYIFGKNENLTNQLGVNNFIVIELIFATFFVFTLLFQGNKFIFLIVIILFNLPALREMYFYSIGENTFNSKVSIAPIALDEKIKVNIYSYLKYNFPNKKIIKYVDLTPMWGSSGVENFPKSFPYMAINNLNLSSYHGFNFYLSTQKTYMERMPIEGNLSLYPDWEWVLETNPDFLVVKEEDMQSMKFLAIKHNLSTDNLLRLPNNILVIPFLQESPQNNFDNGFFEVSSSGTDNQH
jgi:hypothetical protein